MTHMHTRPWGGTLALLILLSAGCIDLPTGQSDRAQEDMQKQGEEGGDMGQMDAEVSDKDRRLLGTHPVQLNGAGCLVEVNEEGCFEHVRAITGASADQDTQNRCQDMIEGEIRFKEENKCGSELKRDGYLLGFSTSYSDRIPPFSHASLFFRDPLKEVNGGSIRIRVDVLFDQIFRNDDQRKETFRYGALCITLHTDDSSKAGALGSTGRFWGTGHASAASEGETYDPGRTEWEQLSSTAYVMRPDGGSPEGMDKPGGRGVGIDQALCGGVALEFETKQGQDWLGRPIMMGYYDRVTNIPLGLVSRFTPIYELDSRGRKAIRQSGSDIFSENHPFTHEVSTNNFNMIPRKGAFVLELLIGQDFITLKRQDPNELLVNIGQARVNNHAFYQEQLQNVMNSNKDVYVGVTASTAGGGMDIVLRNVSVTYTRPQSSD